MPKYYEISEAAAKRAKDMNSYSDYAPGSATAGYRAMVDEAYALAEKQKAQVDPMYHDKIDALVDRYARRLAENLNERNAIDARVPSILITGGGNFPVAKKAKQNAARDRNYGEYAEIEKLLDKIRSTGRGGISADDDLAVEKLTKKLEGMKSQQAMMKAVNAYYRKHKTLEGCPELTAEQVEKVIELLLNNDKVLDFISPIPQGTKLLSCKVSGGEAVVNFSPNYGRLSGFDLTVANYCITLSASQIPGVRRIHILIDGESLSGQDDALSTGDVLLTSSEDVVKAVPVVLYFPDSTGELQPEKRELLIYEGENHCQRVLEALTEGPNTEGLYALVPEGIHIAGVWMDGDICCLNFSLTDYRALCESTVDQGMLVEGLVKSLCSLKGVERVQFMVNGAYRTRLGVVDIENPIRP